MPWRGWRLIDWWSRRFSSFSEWWRPLPALLWSCSELCGFVFLSLFFLQSLKFVCHGGFWPRFISLLFGSGLIITAASGKKPCLAHCRSFRRSLPKRKIFAVWTDLETWPWLSRCASLAMPANDEGKLIAYKWRKSAILETPEQIFLPGAKLTLHI